MLGSGTVGTAVLGGTAGAATYDADHVQEIVEVAFDDGPLETPTRWYDITDYVHSWRTRTGRASELDEFSAGQATITLDNTDRRFDVDHATGPYFGRLTYNRQVRIRGLYRGVWWPIFHGFVDQWGPVDYDPSHDYTQLTITATDAFKLLAAPMRAVRVFTVGHPDLGRLDDPTLILGGTTAHFDEETSGSRVRRILTMLDWPAHLIDVDPGVTLLREDEPADTSTLEYLQRIERSELGMLYIAPSGALTFRGRRSWARHERCRESQATFSDQANNIVPTYTPATLPAAGNPRARVHGLGGPSAPSTYSYVGLEFDPASVALVRNVIIRANDGSGREFRATNERSRRRHGAIQETWTDLLVADEGELGTAAEYRLSRYGRPAAQVRALTVDSTNAPAALLPLQLGLQIGERITVERTPAPGGPAVRREYTIQGVEHDRLQYGQLVTTWLCSLADTANYFTIGHPTRGRLDDPTVRIAY